MRYVERVLAVDPGKTTGMCVMERVKSDAGHTVGLVSSRETGPDDTIPLFREWYAEWAEPVGEGPRMRVVVESFKINPRTGEKSQDATWALRTIGAVEQACRDLGYPVAAIAWQRPDQKKAFPNDRLRKLGLWHVGGGGHALDSIRHGTLYLSQTGLMPGFREETS